MKRVRIHAPGLLEPVEAQLPTGSALLLGRAPESARIPPEFAVDLGRLTPIVLPSERVSSTHALIVANDHGVRVLDLGSRNGSALRLPAGCATQLSSDEVVLDLASDEEEVVRGLPDPPSWTSPDDFARCVTESASRWLAALEAPIEIALVPRSEGTQTLQLALATGETLGLHASMNATADARTPAILDALASFVAAQNALLDEERGHDADFILRAPRFREAHRRVYDAALRGRRLLLLGASGTGKDRLGSCYHLHSTRRDGPFRALNCALMDKELIWVQLFGASRGSYTGSVRDVVGAVELAHGGTLFLDEVAELSPRMQAALLRFLDRKGEFERLGDQRVRRADVQIVCATNTDLRAAVARGEFREDLWYRFAGSVVEVPSLRERPEDVDAFLAVRRHPDVCSAREILSTDALDALRAYPWPGNFRELENFVARLPLSTRAGVVDASMCAALLREGALATTEIVAVAPTSHATSWNVVNDEALRAFCEDHEGRAPTAYGELRDFFEGYLRPVYVAHAVGVAGTSPALGALNHSALGRQLGIADGSTVRRCLERYAERFGKGS